MDKPALSPFGPFERIEVDETDQDVALILMIAIASADDWMLGPEGPYQVEAMTNSARCEGMVRAALLHLLELGLVDIDVERCRSVFAYPLGRNSNRP